MFMQQILLAIRIACKKARGTFVFLYIDLDP
jgi:hypothetical protein